MAALVLMIAAPAVADPTICAPYQGTPTYAACLNLGLSRSSTGGGLPPAQALPNAPLPSSSLLADDGGTAVPADRLRQLDRQTQYETLRLNRRNQAANALGPHGPPAPGRILTVSPFERPTVGY